MKRLRDIATLRSGYTFRKGVDAFEDGGVHVFQTKDILTSKPVDRLPAIEFTNQRQYLQEGDVLLSARGLFCARAPELGGKKAVASSSLIVIRLTGKTVLPGYLALYLNSSEGQYELSAVASGAAVKTLTKGELENLPVHIPPKNIQQTLLGLVQNISQQQQILANRQKLLNKILDGATTAAKEQYA